METVAHWKEKTLSLTDIHQGLEHLHTDFMAQLLQDAGLLLNDPEVKKVLMKQLAFENANNTCKKALRSFYKCLNVQKMIGLYANIGPSHLQGQWLSLNYP